jgi:hypothetical protein
MNWVVSVRGECGHWSLAEINDGLVVPPEFCRCERQKQQKPSRLRIWWEARKMRAWLRKVRGVNGFSE